MKEQPSLDLLLEKVDSKYTLVVAVAKRARALVEGASVIGETESGKAVSIALKEIAEDRIKANT